MKFGQRLQQLRIRKKFSVSQVARLLEVSESTYRDWENGRQIKGEPYIKMARVFEISLAELFLGEVADPRHLGADIRHIEELLRAIRLRL